MPSSCPCSKLWLVFVSNWEYKVSKVSSIDTDNVIQIPILSEVSEVYFIVENIPSIIFPNYYQVKQITT